MNNQKFFEEFYSYAILPKYVDSLDINDIQWIDHGKIDDSYTIAHYFKSGNNNYVLLSNDYAESSLFNDGLSHEIVKSGDNTNVELIFTDKKEIDNITGIYTLYRENKH